MFFLCRWYRWRSYYILRDRIKRAVLHICDAVSFEGEASVGSYSETHSCWTWDVSDPFRILQQYRSPKLVWSKKKLQGSKDDGVAVARLVLNYFWGYLECYFILFSFSSDEEFIRRWIPSNSIGKTRYQSIYLSQMELPYSKCVTTDFLSRNCRSIPLSFARPVERAWRPITQPILISDDDEDVQPAYSSMKISRPGIVAPDFLPHSKWISFKVRFL